MNDITPADVPDLLLRLSSHEDATRRLAVFKLQAAINDLAFADIFIASGGLDILRQLILHQHGNILAYALQSLTRLLEVDMGWDIFVDASAGAFVERLVELIVTSPLVNILRGAMSVLVALVGHSQSEPSSTASPNPTTETSSSKASPPHRSSSLPMPGSFGFRSLKPAVAVYPQFFDIVLQQLQSADHTLCANALMLTNALIRDSISRPSTATKPTPQNAPPTEEWSKFVLHLKDRGLMRAVYQLMQSTSLQDLAHPLFEFQSLVKVLLRKWREVRVDLARPDHQQRLETVHLLSSPRKTNKTDASARARTNPPETETPNTAHSSRGSDDDTGKWVRLGFGAENPLDDLVYAGYLGVMDLSEYVENHEAEYRKLLQEQAVKPPGDRCPIARASLASTLILYDYFDVEKAELDETRFANLLDNTKNLDLLFRPLLLQWTRLHACTFRAFLRLWRATGARPDDFERVGELVRILVEHVVGQSTRTRDISSVVLEFQEFGLDRLRDLQMELYKYDFEENWGHHLYQVREELRTETMKFMREQRIRCLLHGSWFSLPSDHDDDGNHSHGTSTNVEGNSTGRRSKWRYAKLAHNRRYLHYADYFDASPASFPTDPSLHELPHKVDLRLVSSVASNITKSDERKSAATTVRPAATTLPAPPPAKPSTKITMFQFTTPTTATQIGPNGASLTNNSTASHDVEEPLLVLYPLDRTAASEWLDGLLLLLNQTPITADTSKYVQFIMDFGLKIRLLNLGLDTMAAGPPRAAAIVPSREHLDEDYYYAL